MGLAIIGLGLYDEKDITLRGLEHIKNADVVYLENYTSLFEATKENLENLYEKKVNLVDRDFVERGNIIEEAKSKNVAFIVIGDSLSATTHFELFMQAKRQNVDAVVVHNASILTAVAMTGLQLYKFGKTASIPFASKKFNPESYYDILEDNQRIGAHTLFLLDIQTEARKYMAAKEAIKQLLDIEHKRKRRLVKENTICVVVEKAGSKNCKVISGSAKELLNYAGSIPQLLIIPGKLHFLEEEAITLYRLQENSHFHR